jgi:hypothetical protein
MVDVSRSGAARRTIFCHNFWQSTARIARTARKVLISKDFVRAVLSIVYRPPGTITDRSRTYRPRIDRLEISRFAGLSPPHWLLWSVRSLVIVVGAVGRYSGQLY